MSPFQTLRTVLRPLALTAVFGASLALAGCGGGGGGDEEDEQQVVLQQISIDSTPELDGVVFGDNADVQGRADLPPHVGDFQFQTGVTQGAARLQAVYSFDLSQLPEGATIRSAKLSLYVTEVIGNPNAAMALVRVDQVNFGTIFPANFGMQTIDVNFATITDIDVIGRKEVDVTAQLQADLEAGRARSQYRLKGGAASNFDDAADASELTDGEDSAGNGELPRLILEIEVPASE